MEKVYIMRNGNKNKFKFGVSKHPKKRVKQLQTGNPNKIKILFICVIDPNVKPRDVETIIHNFLKENNKHVNGEWFELSEDNVFNIAKCMLCIGQNIKAL